MSLVANERIKLTAGYLNTGAGGLFTTGVVAPVVATAFGLTGPGTSVSVLTLAVGVLVFLSASLALHAAARYVLKGLAP